MDDFKFFIPFDVVKSEDTNENMVPEMRIAGYASTSQKDRQDEEIMQKGLDISEFINNGWFNYDHDNTKILGYPDKDKCRVDKNGFYVEGCLIPGIPLAKSLWETALSLKKSNAPRKLGFSIEGKTLQRDALGRITKAKVYNVAITANPVNTSCTWDALVKSFTSGEPIDKSASAGYEVPIGETTSGASNKPESLDSAIKVLAECIGEDEKAQNKKKLLKESMSKNGDTLSKSEMVLYLQITRGLSNSDAMTLVNKFNTNKEVNG